MWLHSIPELEVTSINKAWINTGKLQNVLNTVQLCNNLSCKQAKQLKGLEKIGAKKPRCTNLLKQPIQEGVQLVALKHLPEPMVKND